MRYSQLVLKYRDWFYYKCLERHLVGCGSVLDVGCGENSPLGRVNKTFYAEGVDGFRKSIIKSKKNKIHDKYQHCDISKIKDFYKAKSFDAVIALDVIEHFKKSQAKKLIRDLEEIANKKIILLTPNGFYKQNEIGGNPYQVHYSGWSVRDFKKLGYTIVGLRGFKYLKGDFATLKFKPWIVWAIISFLSEPILYRFPLFSYHLFAVKEKNEKKK